MAQLLEQYINRITTCENYDSLADVVDLCVRKNVINHVYPDLQNAVDSLGFSTSYSRFVRSLVWASTISEHCESSLNLLRYFCNKLVSNFDNLVFELDDFSLMVAAICADDKTFISKLPSEKKDVLINTLCQWYLARTDEDINNPVLMEQIRVSIDLIIQGKTMEELDSYFKNKYEIDLSKDKDYHKINEIIRPFQALFINICHNIDHSTLLNQLNVTEWGNLIDEKMRELANRYSKVSKNKTSSDVYLMFFNDIIMGFHELKTRLASTGYVNVANPVVGQFMLGFLNTIHFNYTENELSTKEISMLLRDAKTLFFSSFAIPETVQTIINSIVGSYTESGDYEDVFLRGDYFEGIKSYLHNDEAFKLWVEFTENTKHSSIPDRVYATYLHKYLNPELELAEKLIGTLEQEMDVATEARGRNRVYAVNSRTNLGDDKSEDEESNYEEEYEEEPPKVKKKRVKKKPIKKEEEPDYEEENEEFTEDDSEYEDEEPRDDRKSSSNNGNRGPTRIEEDPEYEKNYDGPEIEAKQSTKGYKKASKVQSDGERKIYNAYKKYKDSEAKVDSQLSKMLSAAKRAFSQDKTEEIIEGKKFTPLGLLKKILITGAIFNYSKTAGFIYLLVSHTISKRRTKKQKSEILLQIETELKMMDEKIEDARGDGNRRAKYALMRTKTELERARDKIKYDLKATKEDMRIAKKYVNNEYRDNV